MFEDYTMFYGPEGLADPYEKGSHPHTCHFVANLLMGLYAVNFDKLGLW